LTESRIVFVAACVSLTRSVALDGAVHWWLTKESGKLAPWCGFDECMTCAALGGKDRLQCCAYLVVKVQGPNRDYAVALSLLSKEALEVAIGSVFPDVDRIVGCGSAVSVSAQQLELFSLLHAGLYSSAAGCKCSVGAGVCTVCTKVRRTCRRFVWRDRFDGVFPLGPSHWFSGVTDACGDVGKSQIPWLFCWECAV
jgi:hypothetical protein